MRGDVEIKKLIIIFLFLILPIVCAENFNTHKSLIISNSISGDIKFIEKKSNSYVEYFKADIFFFPQEDFQQYVKSQSIITKPNHSSWSATHNNIFLTWDELESNKISFKIDSIIEVKNEFPKVFQTVSFPIQKLSSGIEGYTEETEHIDINQGIKDRANELVSGETDLFIATYKIGEWVKKSIRYDLSTLTAEADQKASWVFAYKRGVCDEITNLFIAMLRSVNIPSRFVSGVVYSNLDNSFGSHGWAEVYFQGYGWIPFDVTFGQYGWVDPTHIKLDASYDSGIPSVEYHWKSHNIEIDTVPLGFETEVIETKGKLSPYVSLAIKPLRDKVRFGSYMPIEVIVENLKSYYVPQTIFISKAPDIFKSSNVQYFVLKPKEKKTFYWIVKIPSNLEESYIYTSDLEVKNGLGTVASNKISYAKNFEYYSEEWALDTKKRLSVRENKFFFANVDLNCNSDKSHYYPSEDLNINCLVSNLGNIRLDEVNVCLAEGCKRISLGIGEKEEVEFTKSVTSDEIVRISAENKNMVRYSELEIDVVEIPNLQVLSLEPESIGYNELGTLVLSLITESPAYNVKLEIKNFGFNEWANFSDKIILKIPFEGRDFSSEFVEISMSYDDILNKTYFKNEQLSILVMDVPLHVKFLNWLKNIF